MNQLCHKNEKNVNVIRLHTSKNIGFNVLLCKDGQRSIHIIKQLKTEMRKYQKKKMV